MRRALVIGHADADGHLIAEQVRRNLALVPNVEVSVAVDPVLTKDHTAWLRLDQIPRVDDADLIFFVDLMFGPMSFVAETAALSRFVKARPQKKFFLVDHHPIPFRRLENLENLHAVYRPDVVDCAFGPRSGLMVVAAICENQGSLVREHTAAAHETFAIAMKRAAAPGGPLPGEKLLGLLRAGLWEELARLATDDKAFHKLPRGRRSKDSPISESMIKLNELAEHLLANPPEERSRRDREMSFDTDIYIHDHDHLPAPRTNERPTPKDLETIVTLLELGALSLTVSPDSTFTLEKLLSAARAFVGDDFELTERDAKIVISKARFLEKVGRGEYRLR